MDFIPGNTNTINIHLSHSKNEYTNNNKSMEPIILRFKITNLILIIKNQHCWRHSCKCICACVLTLYVCRLSTTQISRASRPTGTVMFCSRSPNLGKSVELKRHITHSKYFLCCHDCYRFDCILVLATVFRTVIFLSTVNIAIKYKIQYKSTVLPRDHYD